MRLHFTAESVTVSLSFPGLCSRLGLRHLTAPKSLDTMILLPKQVAVLPRKWGLAHAHEEGSVQGEGMEEAWEMPD